MKKYLLIVSIVLNLLFICIVMTYRSDSRLGYQYGYNQGRKDTTEAFAKAYLGNKVYRNVYPLVLGNNVKMENCWFITGSTADPFFEIMGKGATLIDVYINICDHGYIGL